MKKLLAFLILFLFPLMFLAAQDENYEIDLIDMPKSDLDSIFDEPLVEISGKETEQNQQEARIQQGSIISDIRRKGIEFGFSYYVQGAVNPGWDVFPWELKDENKFSWTFGAEIGSLVNINAQISENFRVRSVIKYTIPGLNLTFGDFFFDYNFFDKVFLRAGKYEQTWGVSPNFTFTNLLSRIADDDSVSVKGTSYIVKFDVPIGIGGLQALALTRANLAAAESNKIPYRNFIGFGGKLNLAFNWADFNLGIFIQKYMPVRSFLSVKTNIYDTDIYNEWLISVNDDGINGFAFNVGFIKTFLNDAMWINGEYLYNGEASIEYYKSKSNFSIQGAISFHKGHNFAFNFLYRLGGKIKPNVFTNIIFAHLPSGENSISFIPGVRITPLPDLDVYLALPMVFGDDLGFFNNMAFLKNKPLSLLLFVNLKGSYNISHYK
ncbi:MAG: hypothetical protein FWC22_04135 [Treponema sp.]|nr:hypothetical protein [Treponema sp.]